MSRTTTKADWIKRRVGTITLPSGAVVKIQIPNMPALIKAGRISNDLITLAAELEASTAPPTVEQLEEQAAFVKTIISLTLVEPEVTEAEVDELPVEDQSMIVEFAMRQRVFDAVYHTLGGLETIQSFRDVHTLG